MESHSREDLLRSWKEIASYLGVDERTCSRWEHAFGMPVHRAGEGAAKSRVFAYKSELDLWFQETFKNSTQDEPQTQIRPRRPAIRIAVIAIVVLLIVSAFFAIRGILTSHGSRAQPAGYRFDKSVLIIADEQGRELWRYDTKLPDFDADAYRDHFQEKKPCGAEQCLPFLIIKDINSDGWNEVLFSTHTRSQMGEGELFCFDHSGTRLWHYDSGREMIYGSKVYSNDYRIKGIDCVNLDSDGSLKIIVIAVHNPEWPCQFSILDSRGNRVGEFWNSGHISDYSFRDINADGRVDIIISGINNEEKTGFLAVFDSAHVSGGSPQQEDEYTCKSLSPGSQKYYILIPRTDVDIVMFPVECLAEVKFLRNGRLSAKSSFTSLYYEFGPDMKILDVKDSHTIKQLHKELLRQGLVKTTLNQDYYENLKRKVLYWNGKNFTNTPAKSNPW